MPRLRTLADNLGPIAIDDKVGTRVVRAEAGRTAKHNSRLVRVECDCGKFQVVEAAQFLSSSTCRACAIVRAKARRPHVTPGFVQREESQRVLVDRNRVMAAAIDAALFARIAKGER